MSRTQFEPAESYGAYGAYEGYEAHEYPAPYDVNSAPTLPYGYGDPYPPAPAVPRQGTAPQGRPVSAPGDGRAER
ncbi:resuscitation-promoting factor, partial [Streptomyces sp. SID10362]|nr:resuscitation-promoting factor [Streptomyces sp. SID10362]